MSTSTTNDSLPLLQMLQVADSMFPIGAFTLSDGLETFVYERRLDSIEDLEEYVGSYLTVLSYNDLAGMVKAFELCRTYGTCRTDQTVMDQLALLPEKLSELDNLMYVLKAPLEVRDGSQRLCSRFIKLWKNLSEYKNLYEYSRLISVGECYGVHAIAVGLYAYDIGLDIVSAASIYTYQKMSALVTNAVKTVPLSQIKGQMVLAESLKLIPKVVEKAISVSDDELGFGGSMFDIESMRHETLYSRLYMS